MDEAHIILQELGLTQAQASVYLALLKQSQVPAQLSRKTGLHRRSIILILRLLQKQHLVQKDAVGLYCAASLDVFQQLLQQKKKLLMSQLPSLSAQYEATKDTQIVNLVKGLEGVKSILADELLKGKPISVLFGRKFPEEYKPHIDAFDAVRVKQNIPLQVIGALPDLPQRPACQTKFFKAFHTPMEIHIYANKVGIFVWEQEPFVISIKKDEVTASWKAYFEWLWGIAH